MLGYYVKLALLSLRRSPGLTALMVLSIGIGVALAMTTWTLERSMTRDPIPEKSAELFVPTIDMWGPSARSSSMQNNNEPPNQLDYSTTVALMRDHRARFQSPVYWLTPSIIPARVGDHPFNSSGFAVSDEFFPMLDVPFQYGTGWGESDGTAGAQVVVISRELNDKLFDGGDSVGKTLNIDGHNFRIVGVLARWDPQPVYYDVAAFGGFSLQPTEFFLPFNTAITLRIPSSGPLDCVQAPKQAGFDGLMRSTCAWISYMVQLDNTAAVQEYKNYLEGLARQRYSWPPNVRLRDLMSWLEYLQVVPSGIKILKLVGFGLLVVCLVDTIGLMLAKFLRRGGEIGVRRALGAPRYAIYAQFLTEGAVVGVAGGVVGILLTWLAMLWLRAKFPQDWSQLTEVNVTLLILTLVVAVVATVLAALYPTWRAAHIQPAWQLKTN